MTLAHAVMTTRGLRLEISRGFPRSVPVRQISKSCPAPFAKIFPFPPDPNQIYMHRRPTPLEGRIAIVTDAGLDAVDAAASGDVRGWQGGSIRPVS
jgi:hypothetical protein